MEWLKLMLAGLAVQNGSLACLSVPTEQLFWGPRHLYDIVVTVSFLLVACALQLG
jgi:hypothetical protein